MRMYGKMYNEGRRDASNSVTGDGVKNSIAYKRYNQDEINHNCAKLIELQSVVHVEENEFNAFDKNLSKAIDDYFASLGNSIYTGQFGDVALSNSSRRSEIRHGHTREKVSAYPAIPSVLRLGVVINAIEKENGNQRIVVAAPITIGNANYYMGVMLKRDHQNQRLYIHDIVAESQTQLEKEASNFGHAHLNTTGSAQNTDNLFLTDILIKSISIGKQHIANESKSQADSNESAFSNGEGGSRSSIFSTDALDIDFGRRINAARQSA